MHVLIYLNNWPFFLMNKLVSLNYMGSENLKYEISLKKFLIELLKSFGEFSSLHCRVQTSN